MKYNSGYVIGCFNINHNQGLLKTLESIATAQGTVIVPDVSIFPEIAAIEKKVLNQEQQAKFGSLYDVLTSLLSRKDKTFLSPQLYESIKANLESEGAAAERKDLSILTDKVKKCLNKLRERGTEEILVGHRKEVYKALVELVRGVERRFDIRNAEEPNIDSMLDTFAFTTALAVTSPSKGYNLITIDDFYLRLFDNIFGVSFNQAISRGGQEGLTNLKRNLNNLDLIVTTLDQFEASQPFVISRRTRDSKDYKVPRKFLSLALAEKEELRQYLMTAFGNFKLLLNGSTRTIVPVVKADAKKEETPAKRLDDNKAKVISPDKKVPSKHYASFKDLAKNTATPEKVEEKQKADAKKEETLAVGETRYLGLPKDEIGNLYERLRINSTNVGSLDSAGLLERELEIYLDLVDIARSVGAQHIVGLIGSDIDSIRTYLSGDKTKQIEALERRLIKERTSLKSNLGLLDDIVKRIAAPNPSLKDEKKTEFYGPPEPDNYSPVVEIKPGPIITPNDGNGYFSQFCSLVGEKPVDGKNIENPF